VSSSHAIPASDVMADARAVYERLRSEAKRPQRRKSLELLWNVLESMRAEGELDYSIPSVGEHLETSGSLGTQSIRNAPGKPFRDLIAAYAAAAGGSRQRKGQREQSPLDFALESVADPAARALLRQCVAEHKRCQHEKDQLRSAFKRLSVGNEPAASPASSVPQAPSAAFAAATVLPPSPAPGVALHRFEIEAVRAAVDDDRLAENGWTVQPNGSIVSETGQVLLPPGFATSLAKMIDVLTSERA
jgi:hypothetical protein